MSQQVNLFQPIFRAQPKVFSATTILQASALLLVGLIVIYGYARWQDAKLGQEIKNLQARQDATLKQIEDFNKRYPVKQKSAALEKQLTELSARRAGRQRALEILSSNVFGNTQGFSVYLQGLARQHIEGLWLTGLTIGEGGDALGLTGSATEAQQVPRFLQQLGAEKAFTGREFKTFQLTRADAPPRIDFTLHTAAQSVTPR